jgi:hypothetical protein
MIRIKGILGEPFEGRGNRVKPFRLFLRLAKHMHDTFLDVKIGKLIPDSPESKVDHWRCSEQLETVHQGCPTENLISMLTLLRFLANLGLKCLFAKLPC